MRETAIGGGGKRMGMAMYSFLLAVGLGVSAPWWGWRMATSGRYREGLAGRLGRVPAGLRAAVEGKRVVWVHAVSVGEVFAAARLVGELGERLGAEWVVVMSTTTATGQKVAKERFGVGRVFYFPLDFGWVVRRYLRALRPELVVLVESELWPRLLCECERGKVPVAVVNARMSDRSFRRALRLSRAWRHGFQLWRAVLDRVSLFLTQGEESAKRLRKFLVDADRIKVVGNMKYDAPAPTPNALTCAIGASLPVGAQLVVCGSTLEGEENVILEHWLRVKEIQPHAVLLLAPRHPQRFEQVAELVALRGLAVWRASEFESLPLTLGRNAVILLDTIGSLAALYESAAVAFIGGSLIAKQGGHNPLEAARFGVPVVMGESYENFREIVEGMRGADAIRIVDANGLGAALLDLLKDDCGMGERGRYFFEGQAGATGRTVAALVELIHV